MLARVSVRAAVARVTARAILTVSLALSPLLAGCDAFGPHVETEDLTSPCPGGSESSARLVAVRSSQVNIRTGPGTSFDRVVDHPRSRERNAVSYASLKPGLTLLEECRKDGWSRVWVTEPAELRATHHGWVVTRFLAEIPQSARKAGGPNRG